MTDSLLPPIPSGARHFDQGQPCAMAASITTPMRHTIGAIIRARTLRSRYLPATLLGEPSWDMLLDLMLARQSGQAVPVTSLCVASGVPTSTALRYMAKLEAEGLVRRVPDRADARRILVSLTEDGARLMQGWLEAALPVAGHGAGRG